jgi:transcriptional regulator with AAA-type ATPase domain
VERRRARRHCARSVKPEYEALAISLANLARYYSTMANSSSETTTEGAAAVLSAGAPHPVPGLVMIFANGRPTQRLFRVDEQVLELGRVELVEEGSHDGLISRKHVGIQFDGTAFSVADLQSRNGTFVQGVRISGVTRLGVGGIIRVGGVMLLTVGDIVGYRDHATGVSKGTVAGPALRKAFETVAITQRMGMVQSLLISGESGTGKELAAQVFHASGPRPQGPFSALNCATIPKELAERLLFGSRRGAFSGATDAQGHVQAANGGTLFLDEIAELPGDVQSKLLRMLETREVLRLGATSYEGVDVRVCAATWCDLRQEVAAGRFREDLYYRIGQPEVRLPALRNRIEEIPWHIQQVLDNCGAPELRVSAPFVEACALRHWSGNVRELRAEVRRTVATVAARAAQLLTAEDLSPTAGKPITRTENGPTSVRFPDDEFAAALAAEQGNVVGAARRLGVNRNKIRRWLEQHRVDAKRFKPQRRKLAE